VQNGIAPRYTIGASRPQWGHMATEDEDVAADVKARAADAFSDTAGALAHPRPAD
jgi:hypothetical protein